MKQNLYYRKQIVAFIDLLGFKNIVEEVHNDEPKAIEKINYLIDVIEKSIKHNIYPGEEENDYEDAVKYKIFSDCICLSLDCVESSNDYYTCASIYMFLLDLINIQSKLIIDNIFIRGAVIVDKHFYHENLIFSSALNHAYKLESTKAVNPRILIDTSVIDILRKYQEPLDLDINYSNYNKIIKRDADGLLFLDYIESHRENEQSVKNYLNAHKNVIEERLKKEINPYVISKYLWVANYHNQKILQLQQENITIENLNINSKYLYYKDDVFTIWYLFAFKIVNSNEHLIITLKSSNEVKATLKITEYIKSKTNIIINNLKIDFIYEAHSIEKIEYILPDIKKEFKVREIIQIV